MPCTVTVPDDFPDLGFRAPAKRHRLGKAPCVVCVDASLYLPLDLRLHVATGLVVPVAAILHDVEDVARGVVDADPAIVASVEDAPQAWSPWNVAA